MGNSREKEGCLVLVKSCPMQRINDVECQWQCWAWQRIIRQVWLREEDVIFIMSCHHLASFGASIRRLKLDDVHFAN